ncbi:MAG: glutamate-cysteine ligase family protein [Planctomycetota bacterium]
MGVQEIGQSGAGSEHRAVMQRLLNDLRALEAMLDRGMFESGITRIGAEQELAFVDHSWVPAMVGPQVLERLGEPRATSEIGRFNLEFNCTPRVFERSCLRDLHRELEELMGEASRAAEAFDATPVLTGILPTLQPEHLTLDCITPKPRYFALNDRVTALRKGRYDLRIRGTDVLDFTHDNIMVEALNTSIQIHYQVDPERFADAFNVAQLVTGPLLAACANSPVLFGKRLWHENRIAIFEQIVDTTGDVPAQREMIKRVRFGEAWCESGVLELYKADIARFRSIFGAEHDEHPLELIERGQVPRLAALGAHNSTLYRWNRPCYGITDGKPHLRIENRYLPSGPTIVDEVAATAFWLGLMHRLTDTLPDLRERMPFELARANFVNAARQGLDAQMHWLDGRSVSARSLILTELLPEARAGLTDAGIDAADIGHYLGVIHDRVDSGQNGAKWMLDSVAHMRGQGTRAERLATLTAATSTRQRSGAPVHEWPIAELHEAGTWELHYTRVGQYMTTDLFTVRPDELIDLAASIMDWERVRHVPVEDDQHRLVGLVSYRCLLRLIADPQRRMAGEICVSDIMNPDPLTVTPDTPTLEAIELMRAHSASCLPVLSGGKLVGLVSEHDYMRIAGRLLEEQLRAGSDGRSPPGNNPA